MKHYPRPNKVILLSAIALVFVANLSAQQKSSQECGKYIDVYDKMTGETLGKPLTLLNGSTNKGLIINWRFDPKTNGTSLLIKPINAGYCVDKGSPIYFLFKDGTKLTLNNQSNFNCDDKVEVSFQGAFHKEMEFKFLKTKKIEMIRVMTSTSNVAYSLSGFQATEFMNTATCISENYLTENK